MGFSMTGIQQQWYVLFVGKCSAYEGRKKMFYLWLFNVRHMVKDHLDSERGNPLPPHGLLFLISSKGSFICIIPQTG